MKTIANAAVSLTLDRYGRLVSLRNRRTDFEWIGQRGAAEGWRLVVATGLHTRAFVRASQQPPPLIRRVKAERKQQLVVAYDRLRIDGKTQPIAARFSFEIGGAEAVAQARVEIDNRSSYPIEEVEFPVIGGLSGFPRRGGRRALDAIHIEPSILWGAFLGDLLNQGLPNTGNEADQYVRRHETAMWEDYRLGRTGFDFYGEREGLYVGYLTPEPQDFAFTMERFPKFADLPGRPDRRRTPKWLRLWGVHLAQLAPGRRWQSEPVTLCAHRGDWHAGATFAAQRCCPKLEVAEPPKWMDDFVGWTEISGKLYTGEVFHDFAACADKVIADKKVTGLDFLFYYGHTNLGAEGADFDQSPAADLGGEKGFAAMLRKLHANGIRVMLLDHFHRYINRALPQYGALGLERFAVRDEQGRPVESRWWKETVLSCRRLQGPTPQWIEMCPACRPWQDLYLKHVRQTIARGVDGLELDVFRPSRCHSADHGHAPGANLLPIKIEWMQRVRAEAKRLNPDFVLFLETMDPATRAVGDGWYAFRFPNENGRIHRFMFPQLRQEAVRAMNYGFDEVNRALMLGIGIETEIWGLRATALEGCPDLARYIGQVVALRRKYADVLIRGTFRDTLGAKVKTKNKATVYYSVLDGGAAGIALILRNPTKLRVVGVAKLDDVRDRRLWFTRPGKKDQPILQQPLAFSLGPYEAAVLLAL